MKNTRKILSILSGAMLPLPAQASSGVLTIDEVNGMITIATVILLGGLAVAGATLRPQKQPVRQRARKQRR
ncbi:MAG: hypothetical protein ACFBZ9_18315 [Sphingomonadales bacterium]